MPLMADKEATTQKTRPKIGDPIDIPIPTKRDVLADLARTARPKANPRFDGHHPNR